MIQTHCNYYFTHNSILIIVGRGGNVGENNIYAYNL